MLNGEIEIVIKGDPVSVANFFRAASFYPTTTCAAAEAPEFGKTPDGGRAAMEFERSRALWDGNPNIFERK